MGNAKDGRPLCPVCLKPYTERSYNRYRHWDGREGQVTWCKYTTHAAVEDAINKSKDKDARY